MRLNAFLAQAGITSRRGADELIKNGLVLVDGHVGQLNDDVTGNDKIEVSGKQVKLRKSRYILLHKPAGYVTTLKDTQNRPKVVDLVKISERVVPVGRLDFNTTGLLLLTNDGQLAQRLMHPSFGIDKVYEAQVSGKITDEKLNKLEKGIELKDGLTAPAKARALKGTTLEKGHSIVELTIHEGRKHQVKRMLTAIGLPVQKLHRSKYGPLDLAGLEPGQWRDLTEDEIAQLKG